MMNQSCLGSSESLAYLYIKSKRQTADKYIRYHLCKKEVYYRYTFAPITHSEKIQ